MIGRRLIDGLNAGYDQIGTVWLPLLHVAMIPFVRVDSLWRSGIAGAIPAAVGYVIGGVFFFAAARRILGDRPAAVAAAGVAALNPNLLYLQSVPMTEALFYASIAATLYFTVRFGSTRGFGAAAGAGVACCLGTLARYDAWFLLPFIAVYFLLAGKRRGVAAALVFAAIAGLGPAAWAAHNWWETGDWLDFYRGPYSAKKSDSRLIELCRAVRLGRGHVLLPLRGMFNRRLDTPSSSDSPKPPFLLWKRAWWPVTLLALPALFYVITMHSGGTPIFVPSLWPHSYYNARYGIAALPLLALGAATLTTLAPKPWRAVAAVAVTGVSLAPWIWHSDPHRWAALEESQLNDRGRRAWEAKASDFLAAHRQPGESIVTGFYPLTGVLRAMGVPPAEMP